MRYALLLLALAACAPDVGPSRAPIVNGTPDTTSTAIVGVIHMRSDGTRQLCTGTLIAADTVLTAKHCVYEDLGGSAWTATPASDLFVYLGDDVLAPDATQGVTAVTTTPGPYHSGDGAVGGDVALLTTAPTGGITPLRVARSAPATGANVHIVGFGYTASGATGTLGTRHAGDAMVSAVDTGTFTTTGAQWTCTGDSGGPALDAAGDVVGVTSIGPAGCRTSTSIYTRVDANLALIDSLVAPPDAGTSAPDLGTPTVDGGTPSPGDDASSGTDGGGVVGGRRGGCTVGGAPDGAWALVALAVVALARRRRRTAV